MNLYHINVEKLSLDIIASTKAIAVRKAVACYYKDGDAFLRANVRGRVESFVVEVETVKMKVEK